LQELLALLEGKSLSREDAAQVQIAIDDVSPGEGLPTARRAMLHGL